MSDDKELTAKEIKEAILAKKKPPQPVEQAELLGVKGWLFASSSYEFECWREYENSDDPQVVRKSPAKLVQISFRDKTGKACFTDAEVTTVLAGLPRSVIDPVVKAAMRINGFGEEGAKAIVKNFVKTRGVDGLFDLLESIDVRCPICSKSTQPANLPSST
jgi:hypothetical protein